MLYVLFLLSLVQAGAAAGEKTYFVYQSMPFQGYYDDGGFHAIPYSEDRGYVEKFIFELPKIFPKGSKVNGIDRSGKRSVLTIGKVDTGVLLEDGFIMDPPIVYRDEKWADFVWTPGRDVEIVKTEVTPVPPKAQKVLAEMLSATIKNASQGFPDGPEKTKLAQLVKNPPEPIGRKAAGLPDLVFITWEAGAGHFFIYSVSRGEFVFTQMALYNAYDSLNGLGLRPLFFFRIQGKSKVYILAESFDGYEYSVHVILDAETGKTMVATF